MLKAKRKATPIIMNVGDSFIKMVSYFDWTLFLFILFQSFESILTFIH